jgi:hypothetical protein
MALPGAPHPELVGTTTVVVGHQYISSQHVRTAFGLQCTMGRVRSGRSRWSPATGSPPAGPGYFEPIQAVQCTLHQFEGAEKSAVGSRGRTSRIEGELRVRASVTGTDAPRASSSTRPFA